MQAKELPKLYIQSPRMNQLNILKEVAANSRITQAELAGLCSLSVAMVNNYMKVLCGAGLLEYHRKSSKSVSYHLTPSGQRHLEVLQSEMILEMTNLFLSAKENVRDRIVNQARVSSQRVVIWGSGHLAQLAFHSLELADANIVGICDDDTTMIGRDFCGREVLNPSQIRFIAPDAVVIADPLRTEEIYRSLAPLASRGINIIRLAENPQIRTAAHLKKAGAAPSPSGLDLEDTSASSN